MRSQLASVAKRVDVILTEITRTAQQRCSQCHGNSQVVRFVDVGAPSPTVPTPPVCRCGRALSYTVVRFVDA